MQISEKDWSWYADKQAAITQAAEQKMAEYLNTDPSENIAQNFGDAANVSQWVAYRLEERNGRVTKVPVNPRTGGNAMTNNPSTWGTLAEAQAAVARYGANGVGFVFGNGYFGIDLDHVIDPKTGSIAAWAQEIIDTIGSYTELSPSGTGVHIIAKGAPNLPTNRNGALEMYFPTLAESGQISRGRYFTVTGNSYGPAQPISARTKEAEMVWERFIKGKPEFPKDVLPIGSGTTVDYAYTLATRYGEASASLACEMYDAIAAAQGASVLPAVPAETATYQETSIAVRGTIKNKRNTVAQTVGRLVKQAGADTMLQNARRDGAEWAWVPKGDTCSFCIMLASRGWQRQVKKNHAEHIHANCDCTYAVRFDGRSGVQGYDPDAYLQRYEEASDGDWRDKLNAMRREDYAERREEINAQQRAAYAERKQREEKP